MRGVGVLGAVSLARVLVLVERVGLVLEPEVEPLGLGVDDVAHL